MHSHSRSKTQYITQISPAYPPASGYGGGPAVCKELSTELVHRGHSVTVYTTVADDRESMFQDGVSVQDGVEIHRSPLVNNWVTYKFKFFLARNFRNSLKELNSPDIFHVHDLRTPLSVSALREARERDIPIILQPHGTVPRKNRLVLWKRLFDVLWGNELFDSVDHWFALNSEEVRALINQGVDEGDISIIPNGIDLGTVPDFEPGEFREKYDIALNQKMILYLGRLHQSKRVDLLINAMATIDAEDFVLIIAGSDDGDEKRLKERCSEMKIGDRVRFVGRVSEDEKWQAYKDAHLFVTPSFYGFPLTFLEAMSQQTPVLTTSLGDTIDESPDNGIFVLDGTVESLATKIDDLLSDSERLDAASQSAYERVKNEYTWENVVDKIEKKYSEL